MATEPEIPTTGEPLFPTEKCSLPSVPTVEFRFINDCFVPEAPPPIMDCPELLISIAPAGPQGGAGIPGPMGPPGPPGSSPDPQLKAFALEICTNDEPILYVWNDLTAVVGQIVSVGVKCYVVRALTPEEAENIMLLEPQAVEYEGPYSSCENCGCFTLTECEGETPDVIVASSATLVSDGEPLRLQDYLNDVVRLSNGKCYTIARRYDCEDGVAVLVLETYNNCETCLLWELTNCANPGEIIVTYIDLAGQGFAIGDIIKRKSDGACFELTDNPEWDDESPPVEFEGEEEVYETCEECRAENQYRLANTCPQPACESSDSGPGDDIITSQNLHAVVDKWVKVDGECKFVTAENSSSVSLESGQNVQETVEYQGPYDTCDECLRAGVTMSITVVEEVRDDFDALVQRRTTLTFVEGLLTGKCKSDENDIIEIGDCDNPGGG